MYVSPVTQMIALGGISVRMLAGVPRNLPESLVAAAMLKGVEPLDGAPAAQAEPELTAEQVAAAIRELMEAGDAKAFGATGEPKLAALRAKLGKGVTDALRDAAWATVQAEG